MSHSAFLGGILQEDVAALRASGEFDEQWYLNEYPDVAKTGIDPAQHYLWIGQRLGRKGSNAAIRTPIFPDTEYGRWLAEHDNITHADIAAMKNKITEWATKPTFSIIMPVYNTPEKLLREAIESVIAQAYPYWELCIADDCSPSPNVRGLLTEYEAKDHRIKVIYREQNGHISEASNSALGIATGEWYALMDHDDLLPPHALYCIAHAIVHNPDVKLLYSDEDKVNLSGEREGAYFKPDFNLELFRSQNMISHFGVYHHSLIDEVGGFRTEFNGAQDYDLALRCIERLDPTQIHHIPRVLYHWRIVEGSTALSGDEKPYAMLAGERALDDHYRRLGISAKAELIGYGYRTRYEIQDEPLTSIVIPTRNAKGLVEQCIDSILLNTTYENYEIILVDNGSDDPDSVSYFSNLATHSRITLVRDDRPFNYSSINNSAVNHCNGSIVILLNNDTEIISNDWIETIIGLCIQPGVGAVGAKLLYPDNTVQHGGVIIGLGGVAGHAHVGYSRSDPGYFARLGLASEFSAVTAACLAVKKEHFLGVGGLNETDLTVAFNDVDFCLRLRKLGLRNVYTPFAELYHHESATRGYEHECPIKQARFVRECEYMTRTWGSMFGMDPAYNPNLTLNAGNFGLASNPRHASIW